MIDLDALESAARAATPGPWTQAGIGSNDSHWMREVRAVDNRGIVWCGTNPEREAHANARYIASTGPATVLALVRIARVAVSFYNDGISNSNSDEFDSALHDAGLV